MNDMHGVPPHKTLFESARGDRPSAATRAKMWDGVSGASIAGAAGVTGVTKTLLAGSLFGGAITVGVAAALLYVAKAPWTVALAATPKGVPVVEMMLPTAAELPLVTRAPAPLAPPPDTVNPSALAKHPAHEAAVPAYDTLAREASLIASARAALARGDAGASLRAIESARALPARQLEPEELALKAQALRALGRTHDAAAVEAALKSLYPMSALVRSR